MSKILIVDDDAISRRLLKEMLTKGNKGYSVMEAGSGKAAIEVLGKDVPDIILLDAMMPEMDGFETCKVLKADERYKFIPIIFLTVLEKTDDMVKAFRSGADDYIRKPVNAEEVAARVTVHLRIKTAEETEKKLAVASATAAAEKKKSGELERAYGELKMTQAQLVQAEKLSGIGRLAAGVAHELNTPLTGLLGLLRAYRETVKEGTREYGNLDLMLDASEHMARIVNGLTIFARKSKDEFTVLNLNEVIESILSFSSHQLTAKDIKISRHYADDLQKIRGDKGQLQQVVLNIVMNARDAMPEGGEFIVKTRNSESGDLVIAEFIDTGSGVKKEDMSRMFEPFFTTKEEGKGVGLGLSIAHGIMKRHRGTITAENQPTEGTKFTIAFVVRGKDEAGI